MYYSNFQISIKSSLLWRIRTLKLVFYRTKYVSQKTNKAVIDPALLTKYDTPTSLKSHKKLGWI